jgi:hypothetical protein
LIFSSADRDFFIRALLSENSTSQWPGKVWALQQDEGIDFELVGKLFTPDGTAA